MAEKAGQSGTAFDWSIPSLQQKFQFLSIDQDKRHKNICSSYMVIRTDQKNCQDSLGQIWIQFGLAHFSPLNPYTQVFLGKLYSV